MIFKKYDYIDLNFTVYAFPPPLLCPSSPPLAAPLAPSPSPLRRSPLRCTTLGGHYLPTI